MSIANDQAAGVLPPLPHAATEQRRLMQVKVNVPLYEAITAEAQARKLHTRHVVEWGMRAFLLNMAPERAAHLGIGTAAPAAEGATPAQAG